MLRLLRISNLAIINRIEVEFRAGFNVLTGETGAGKSILIGALNVLLGARASPDLIRTGEEEAYVEALFEIPEGKPRPADLEEDEQWIGEVVLSRKISRSGRSRCSINGHLATLKTLQSVGKSLVSIFGQHEHQVLLNREEHGDIVDRFGRLQENVRQTATAFDTWKSSVRELETVRARLENAEKELRENEAAIEELASAALKPGEEESLAQERETLRRAVEIQEKAYTAHQALYSRSGSILESLGDVKKGVAFLVSANPKLCGLQENLDEALYRLEDIAFELRTVAEESRSDPLRLEQIEDRLALIRRLKRKYSADLQGLILLLETLNKQTGDLPGSRAAVRKLEGVVSDTRQSYINAARALSGSRKAAARKLEEAMKKELQQLALPHASFFVTFEDIPEDKGSAQGLDGMEFMFTANPGEDPKPLAKIVSGGELSRIMLAIKALQAGDTAACTVIFDEVDAGIGGRTARAVGSRLARVAASQQVLCVTHLHQIAALGSHHLAVRKTIRGQRTSIEVTPLVGEARIEELARMLGATPESESAKDHVRRLMDSSTAEVPH